MNEPMSAENQSARAIQTDLPDSFSLTEALRVLAKALPQIIAFGLLGAVVGATLFLLGFPGQTVTTSTRVVFAFDGLSQGEYPDRSKFLPEDLISPFIIKDALDKQFPQSSPELQATIRSALSIEGIVPAEVIRQRDRIRALGQVPPRYVPDEYILSLTLPRHSPLDFHQRALLLQAIVNAYRDNFIRTYATLPLAFGNVFETLRSADFFEYELILNEEIRKIESYLTTQIAKSKSFRSQSTNLSFSDLLSQTELFSHIELNDLLGLINHFGLTRDRQTALMDIDYYLQNLAESETKALGEEQVIKDLLSQAQAHAQDYVLGVKSQAAQAKTETPIIDQGLIDSLLANDSYNLLVRRALDAGIKVKEVQAERARLLERRKAIENVDRGRSQAQSDAISAVQHSLGALEASYKRLIDQIRITEGDYIRQQYSDCVRASDQVSSPGLIKPLLEAFLFGTFLGSILGIALYLLGIHIGCSKSRPA